MFKLWIHKPLCRGLFLRKLLPNSLQHESKAASEMNTRPPHNVAVIRSYLSPISEIKVFFSLLLVSNPIPIFICTVSVVQPLLKFNGIMTDVSTVT